MTIERHCILAGTYEQARRFARERNWSPASIVFVDGVEKLRGARGETLYIVGTAPSRSNYSQLRLEAFAGDFTVFYADDVEYR